MISYCVCTSNARCDVFLYCLVLLVRIHSEFRELLSPLLFIDGSFYTNDVVLLFYHVLRECPSECQCVKQWLGIIRTYFLNLRSQERILGVICAADCAGDFNYVYMFEFGILNQTIWSLARCDIVKRFERLIEFSLWGPCTVITDFESICVGRVCRESEDFSVPLSMSCLCIDVLYLIFDYFCHVVVRSLFHVSTMSKVAVKLLVLKCFVPMSAVALCSGRQSPFLEVRFDRTILGLGLLDIKCLRRDFLCRLLLLLVCPWSGSPKWPWTFTKRVREDDSDRHLSFKQNVMDDVVVLDLVLGQLEVVTTNPS